MSLSDLPVSRTSLSVSTTTKIPILGVGILPLRPDAVFEEAAKLVDAPGLEERDNCEAIERAGASARKIRRALLELDPSRWSAADRKTREDASHRLQLLINEAALIHHQRFNPLQRRLREGRYSFDTFERELDVWGDSFARGLFGCAWAEEPLVALQPGMIGYAPSKPKVVIGLLRAAKLGPTDVLYDLGSGLGLVTGLAAWMTSARVVGVEYQKNLVELAQTNMERVGFDRRVSFVCSDVRKANLNDGTAFYAFYPFAGAMAREVFEHLGIVATGHDIQILQSVLFWEPESFVPEELRLRTGGSILRAATRLPLTTTRDRFDLR